MFGFILLQTAQAGVIEISGSFAYNQNDLGNNNYEWSRHWTASIGYYFWSLSEVEFSFQDILNRTSIVGLEDTTFHDQIFSLNWVQYFTSRHSFVSPYFKVGVGQLDREASGVYWVGGAPPEIYDSITAVLGLGIRINLSQTFALHGEATSYLTDGAISTWQQNISANFGLSLYIF